MGADLRRGQDTAGQSLGFGALQFADNFGGRTRVEVAQRHVDLVASIARSGGVHRGNLVQFAGRYFVSHAVNLVVGEPQRLVLGVELYIC